jgi:hypothetical protein
MVWKLGGDANHPHRLLPPVLTEGRRESRSLETLGQVTARQPIALGPRTASHHVVRSELGHTFEKCRCRYDPRRRVRVFGQASAN